MACLCPPLFFPLPKPPFLPVNTPLRGGCMKQHANPSATPQCGSLFLSLSADVRSAGDVITYCRPDVNSHFGFLDIAGFMKERGYWQKVWLANPDPPAIHIFPHWNWQAATSAAATVPPAATEMPQQEHFAPCTGLCKRGTGSAANGTQPTTVTVFAFSNVVNGSIELLLNGISYGNKSITKVGGWSTWDVPYTQGTLVAKAFRTNQSAASCAETAVTTTGAPASVRVSIKDGVGATGIAADGRDVALVMAEILDADGRVVPVAGNVLTFSVSDPSLAEIIGTGNGTYACTLGVLYTGPLAAQSDACA